MVPAELFSKISRQLSILGRQIIPGSGTEDLDRIVAAAGTVAAADTEAAGIGTEAAADIEVVGIVPADIGVLAAAAVEP